jgi:hypothetical protein
VEELKKWIPSRLRGEIVTGDPRTVGGALARLVEMADTELCARIDADDICRPNRLEEQVAFLSSHPGTALVGSQLAIIDEYGVPTGGRGECPLCHDDIVHTLLVKNAIGHPSVTFRRSAVMEVGNYDPEAVLEDYDLWLRLVQRYRVSNLPFELVDYRLHGGSVMSGIEREQRAQALLDLTFISHAKELFGISAEEAGNLRARGGGFGTALRAVKIARHLAAAQGGSTWSRLRSSSLINSLRAMTHRRDVLSLLCFAALDERRGSMWRECRAMIARAVAKTGTGSWLFAKARAATRPCVSKKAD